MITFWRAKIKLSPPQATREEDGFPLFVFFALLEKKKLQFHPAKIAGACFLCRLTLSNLKDLCRVTLG